LNWSPPGTLKPPYYRTELWSPAYNKWWAVAEHLLEREAQEFCSRKQSLFPQVQWRVIYEPH